jgi:RNA 3'-terminal phosphate cyclase (ATP)
MNMMKLDGSHGEGGGQILRSALTLSMITGIPFRIDGIRAKRSKPGLLRQHLTAVNAAREVCGAKVSGNAIGSQTLEFSPDTIQGGDYRFDIGTAGSCTLVLQTVLPALWFGNGPSTVIVTGGTHNSGAPPADFLMHCWLPLVQRMGADTEIELLRHGFYPAGGGIVRAKVNPVPALRPLRLAARGNPLGIKAIGVVAGLSSDIARRELEHVSTHLGATEHEVRTLGSQEGPGNILMIELRHEQVTEIFSAPGEKGVKAESVAEQVVREAMHYLKSGATAGEHLADQLLLPMALAGSGSFTTTAVSHHLRTNCDVIRKFLPVDFELAQSDAAHLVTVY